MIVNIICNACAKLVHTRILLHVANKFANQQHRISSVCVKRMNMLLCLAGASVDNRDEIIGYDEAVFCLL